MCDVLGIELVIVYGILDEEVVVLINSVVIEFLGLDKG